MHTGDEKDKITYFGNWPDKEIGPSKGDPSIHGGKGAGLVDLAQIKRSVKGIVVPEGLIVPPSRHSKSIDEIVEVVKNDFLNHLGGESYNRSNSDKEDGGKRSASGVFKSVKIEKPTSKKIKITEEEQLQKLKRALNKVRESASSESAQTYFPDEEVKMGFVIHRLVKRPNFSGVVENKEDITIINYNTGYGESTASSTIIPNTLMYKNGDIISHTGPKGKLTEYIQKILLIVIEDIKNNTCDDQGNKVDNVDYEFATKKNIVNVVQERRLTKELFINNKGSLCTIYPGCVEGIIVNAEEFGKISKMCDYIKQIKESGGKVIACIPDGTAQYDILLSKIDAIIIQLGGAASHMANKIGECKLPGVCGANIKELKSGTHIVLNTDKFVASDTEGNNLLEPLFTDNTAAIMEHIQGIKGYIFDIDPGLGSGLIYLKEQCKKYNLEEEEIGAIEKIIETNKQNIVETPVIYEEEGYDSCQSHRVLSKIVSQAFTLGGIIYEASLLGIILSLDSAKQIVKSKISIGEDGIGTFIKMAKKYGSNIDFLFPGVTPSNIGTPCIEKYIKDILSGSLNNSVRHIGGVGGIRYDKIWNQATDFKTFLTLKLEEDNRYYPGAGCLHILLNYNRNDIPLMEKIRIEYNHIFLMLEELFNNMKSIEEIQYTDYSVLCSCMLPKSNISADIHKDEKTEKKYNIMRAFHSPQRELLSFYKIFDYISQNKILDIDEIEQTIKYMLDETKAIKSFNSPLHLPRTDKLSRLSNGLIGQLKNDAGEHIVRYGIGHNNQSLEIQEINTIDGNVAYKMIIHKGVEFNGGVISEKFVTNDLGLWAEIQDKGFLKFCFNYLNTATGKN